MSQTDPGDETGSSPEPAKKPRVRKMNPGGSTSSVRTGLLEALGVLKVVNGTQMWRLLRPGAQENKFARAGLNDLEKKGLVLSEGSTSESLKTWGLTRLGKEAAQQVMPAGREVGSIARGAGVHGAAEYEFRAVVAWHIVPAGQSRGLCGFPLAPSAHTRPLADLPALACACRPCTVLHAHQAGPSRHPTAA